MTRVANQALSRVAHPPQTPINRSLSKTFSDTRRSKAQAALKKI